MAIKPLLGTLSLTMALTAAGLGVAPAAAASAQAQQETIYGSQLMTAKERQEYRLKLRQAKTVEEREQIRDEHHKLMQERAKERGVKLPDLPPAQGMHQGIGPGAGRGPGAGMGPGGGMGPGAGMGPGGGAAKP
jgi:hypothetical protein